MWPDIVACQRWRDELLWKRSCWIWLCICGGPVAVCTKGTTVGPILKIFDLAHTLVQTCVRPKWAWLGVPLTYICKVLENLDGGWRLLMRNVHSNILTNVVCFQHTHILDQHMNACPSRLFTINSPNEKWSHRESCCSCTRGSQMKLIVNWERLKYLHFNCNIV